eukprot:Blabericola_migrator_1__8208@NODE_4248_length_1259_cov_6_441275_g2627_i0_p1_GENE_NODE_4248_length_1259_cov_6_441275_g2627_i0NODE_4248_length_1259_cov_6_441275_g2627_i0_p1_ORF_typecomplete_len160_score5_54Peroxin3/PF04882_12/0_072_NODE_4248_length_1259_cov_6_441275_g2627_i0232711
MKLSLALGVVCAALSARAQITPSDSGALSDFMDKILSTAETRESERIDSIIDSGLPSEETSKSADSNANGSSTISSDVQKVTNESMDNLVNAERSAAITSGGNSLITTTVAPIGVRVRNARKKTQLQSVSGSTGLIYIPSLTRWCVAVLGLDAVFMIST